MTNRVIGDDAVVWDDGQGTIHTFLPGTPEADLPDGLADTLGDHVWAGADRPTPTGTRVVAHDADGIVDPPVEAPDPEDADPGDDGTSDPGDPAVTVTSDGPTDPAEALMEHSKEELVEMADARGIATSGTKADLVARILDPESPTV